MTLQREIVLSCFFEHTNENAMGWSCPQVRPFVCLFSSAAELIQTKGYCPQGPGPGCFNLTSKTSPAWLKYTGYIAHLRFFLHLPIFLPTGLLFIAKNVVHCSKTGGNSGTNFCGYTNGVAPIFQRDLNGGIQPPSCTWCSTDVWSKAMRHIQWSSYCDQQDENYRYVGVNDI